MRFALSNIHLLSANGPLDGLAIVIEDRRIAAILPARSLSGMEVHDFGGAWVAPGFIDLQINGCGGRLFNDDISIETLQLMHATNLRHGCTSFLPTLITAPAADLKKALEVVWEAHQAMPDAIPGIHLEGPCLNPKKKGIHDAAHIRPLTDAKIDLICDYAARMTLFMTLAPEKAKAGQIERLAEAGVILAAGHSNATHAEAVAGFQAGIRSATHLFNAMSPLEGRAPGLVGAILGRPDISTGIIADGHHVAWANVAMAHLVKGDQLYLVTDAVTPAGTDMTEFAFAGQAIRVVDGRCVNADGTLAGAAITMIESVANAHRHAGIPLYEAVRMASANPAAVIGRTDMGSIAVGKIANLAIFDEHFRMTAVMDRGVLMAL